MTEDRPPPSFAQQRLVYLGLLAGMSMFAIVVAVLLQQNGCKGLVQPPNPLLDTMAIAVGAASALGAFALRLVLQRSVDDASGTTRAGARFRATLVPLAMLEGGCLLALTVWMMNGNAVPNLVVAVALLSLAITFVPFSDPDAGQP